jgi:hypothetical protein
MWPFVVIAIVLVVLIVGAFIADAAAKAFARDQIRAQLVSALGLPASADVAVDVGPGSILLQAFSGSLACRNSHSANWSGRPTSMRRGCRSTRARWSERSR